MYNSDLRKGYMYVVHVDLPNLPVPTQRQGLFPEAMPKMPTKKNRFLVASRFDCKCQAREAHSPLTCRCRDVDALHVDRSAMVHQQRGEFNALPQL